jgi:hypothetical protein
LTPARATASTNVGADGSAAPHRAGDSAAPSPDRHRSLVSSERTSGSAMLLLAAGSADVARTVAEVEGLERQDHDARSTAEEENARFAAEMRAELAERDALWAKYPREMSALEAAEDAFFYAPTRGSGRDRAEQRLARARKALEAAKERDA